MRPPTSNAKIKRLAPLDFKSALSMLPKKEQERLKADLVKFGRIFGETLDLIFKTAGISIKGGRA